MSSSSVLSDDKSLVDELKVRALTECQTKLQTLESQHAADIAQLELLKESLRSLTLQTQEKTLALSNQLDQHSQEWKVKHQQLIDNMKIELEKRQETLIKERSGTVDLMNQLHQMKLDHDQKLRQQRTALMSDTENPVIRDLRTEVAGLREAMSQAQVDLVNAKTNVHSREVEAMTTLHEHKTQMAHCDDRLDRIAMLESQLHACQQGRGHEMDQTIQDIALERARNEAIDTARDVERLGKEVDSCTAINVDCEQRARHYQKMWENSLDDTARQQLRDDLNEQLDRLRESQQQVERLNDKYNVLVRDILAHSDDLDEDAASTLARIRQQLSKKL
jgi:hypothetical protein